MSTEIASPQARLRLFARYLKEQGLPLTQQREAVASVLFSSDGHLSADDIEGELRGAGERIGKATVYRTLDLLVKSNLVEEHDFGEGFKRYEHRLSLDPVHEHLICQACGRVQEFELPEITAIEARVAREMGFRPQRHRVEIYGLCSVCRERGVALPQDGLTCPIDVV
ncbi:MAG TPA: Fur family transcriptional regulator [Longimicrobiales bacterium]|nr:Fur family transcriptional regulator [Longimicrobiales bacterium]